MSATKYDIKIEQGATFTRLVTLKNADDSPFNLTGYTWISQVRKTGDSNSVVATLAVELVGTEAEGKLRITLTAVQTGSIAAGTYYWDLKLIKSANSTAIRVLEGRAIASMQVSR